MDSSEKMICMDVTSQDRKESAVFLSKILGEKRARLYHPIPIKYKASAIVKPIPVRVPVPEKKVEEQPKPVENLPKAVEISPSVQSAFDVPDEAPAVQLGTSFSVTTVPVEERKVTIVLPRCNALKPEKEPREETPKTICDPIPDENSLPTQLITPVEIPSRPAKCVDRMPRHRVIKYNPRKGLKTYILDLIYTRMEKQELIDTDRYMKRGPGRHRKYEFQKTHTVKQLIEKFFLDGLKKLNQNKYNNERSDACVTMYQRSLKKIALFLLVKVSVRNKYKCNEVDQYLISYTETFAVFAMVFFQGKDTPELLERFLEFTTIYYPTSKVRHITQILVDEGSIEPNVKERIDLTADIRDRTAKKNFLQFIQLNQCMRQIVAYNREIYSKYGESFLKGKAKGCVVKVLFD